MRWHMVWLLPAVSIVLAGCSATQKVTQQVQQKAEEKVAEQAVMTNCKYDKDVCLYFAAQAKMYNQGVTMTSAYANKAMAGQTTVTSMDGKGNMQSVSTKNGKEDGNFIIFNNATYTKDYTDNKWFKMSSGDKDDQSMFNMKQMIEEMKDTYKEDNLKLTVKKEGQEACGSLQCVIYSMSEEDAKELAATKVWIDTKDHFARKMELGSGTDLTTITYTYTPVTIAEPSPVKEFSIPDEVKGNMPSADEIQKMMKDLPQTSGEGE